MQERSSRIENFGDLLNTVKNSTSCDAHFSGTFFKRNEQTEHEVLEERYEVQNELSAVFWRETALDVPADKNSSKMFKQARLLWWCGRKLDLN
jgi:hypothetical protein